MYILTVVLSMVVCPIASLLVEAVIFQSPTPLVLLAGKWFVFWAVGIRLSLAGLRQAITPQFTTEQILGIKSKEPFIIVQELGFANLSLGLLGISSILSDSWTMPAAIAGGLFYGLAGIRHIATKERNRLENIAMVSDLFVFVVLLVYLTGAIANRSTTP
jgi:hypothetical protein